MRMLKKVDSKGEMLGNAEFVLKRCYPSEIKKKTVEEIRYCLKELRKADLITSWIDEECVFIKINRLIKPVAGQPSQDSAADFERFIAAYPPELTARRTSTQRAWIAMSCHRPPIEEILASLEAHKASKKWQEDEGKYRPAALTWVEEQMWHLKLEPAKRKRTGSVSPKREEPQISEEEQEENRQEGLKMIEDLKTSSSIVKRKGDAWSP